MSRLNKTKQSLVYSFLENNNFTLSDFNIQFPDEGDVYVSITFRHDKNYFFKISEGKSYIGGVAAALGGVQPETYPQTHESPGAFKSKETNHLKTFDACIDRVSEWQRNLWQELQFSGFNRKEDVNDFQSELEIKFQQKIENPELIFSKDELEKVYETLDALAARLKKMEEEHSITDAQLKEFLAGINSAKGNASSLPKGIWAGLTKNRFIALLVKLATSPEGRKLALEVAEKYLLGIKP